MGIGETTDLSAPCQSDEILLRPEISLWPELVKRNASAIAKVRNNTHCRRELMAIAREFTNKIIGRTGPDTDCEYIIATGHQANWHHCGILAKDAAACSLARSCAGTCLHLVLDHDISNTALMLPCCHQDGQWNIERIVMDPATVSMPAELRLLSQPDTASVFIEKVLSTMPDSSCGRLWSTTRVVNVIAKARFTTLPELITYLHAVLTVSLGLDILYLPVSKMAQSQAFFAFVVSLILDAERFAFCYNRAIEQYRDALSIAGHRTIRPLVIDREGSIELPFWLIDTAGSRTSLYVGTKDNKTIQISRDSQDLGVITCDNSDGIITQLRKILTSHKLGLRPKAISLTLFIRVFFADWFVHGIGAAGYESITDRIIENYFAIHGLDFGVVTATILLSGKTSKLISDESLEDLKRQSRKLKYNPERLIEPSVRLKEPVRSLIARKRRLIFIAAKSSFPQQEKRSCYKAITQINDTLARYCSRSSRIIEEKIAIRQLQQQSSRIMESREYFFGLFERQRLEELISSIVDKLMQ
jgi:hypothetical protein